MKKKMQYRFERYETKYLLHPEQYEQLMTHLAADLQPDAFGTYTIANLYYDTDDWKLIRTSIEKPVYKEKLRIRSYGQPEAESMIFIELKKKYDGIVYKRRITVLCQDAKMLLATTIPPQYGQIGQEINWFQKTYQTTPKVLIAYDREAFYLSEQPDLRITFDTGLRWRQDALDLSQGHDGYPLLATNQILMEIKSPSSYPLKLSQLLSNLHIYPVSFSKYGTCYQRYLRHSNKEVSTHASIYSHC